MTGKKFFVFSLITALAVFLGIDVGTGAAQDKPSKEMQERGVP